VSKRELTIDTTNFNSAIREMTRLTGGKFEDIVKSEVGSVLSQTITNTPKATKKSIEKSFVKWIRLRHGAPAKRPQSSLSKGTAYLVMKHRYPDDVWNFIMSSADEQKKELARRIGTAKKSWLLLAQRMGITLPKTPPAYVAKALVKGKSLTDQVSHTREVSGSKVGFTIDNFTRSAVRGGGRAALLKAINGRTGYFHRNLRSGAFKKVATMAKKYPGFKIRGL